MTSTTVFSDVVLPAATWYEKHDLSSTDMHPFVHAFSPAISPPWQTRTDFDAFHAIAGAFSRAGHAAPRGPSRPGRGPPAARHTGRDRHPRRRGPRLDGAARCAPVPGVTMPKLTVVERDYPRSRPSSPRWARCWSGSGRPRRASPSTSARAVEYLEGQERRRARRPRRRAPLLTRDTHACEAILALSGTTNGHLASAGFPDPRAAHWHPAGRPGRRARGQPDHLRRHPGPPGAGDHLARVVGLGDRRAALLPVHQERRAPHAVAHPDRAPALLPRPRLDGRTRRAAAGLPTPAEHDPAVRRAPASASRPSSGSRCGT